MVKNIKHMTLAGVVKLNQTKMKEQFDVTLSGSDSPVEGIVTLVELPGYTQAYEFQSIDGTLHLIIARDEKGKWSRVSGTEPYFSGWVDELAEQIVISKQ
jgi:hypothetical protein